MVCTFPVLLVYRDQVRWNRAGIKYPQSVPWDFVAEHREQCLTNHGQTPARLAERGGLDILEMLCVVRDQTWREGMPNLDISRSESAQLADRSLAELLRLLDEWTQKRSEPKP